MKKIPKKIFNVVLIISIFITNFPVTVFATENQYENDLTDLQYASAIMAEFMEINKTLYPFGISIDDLKDIPQKESKFYEELQQILTSSATASTHPVNKNKTTNIDWNTVFSDANTSKVSEDSRTSADLWAYAYEMASLNKKRDPNSKVIYEETKYMFMSHFIDIRDGLQYFVDKTISNDVYFSAWITNDDRKAYDTYLKSTKNGSAALATSTALVNLVDGATTLREADFLQKTNNLTDILKKVIDGNTLQESIKDFYNNFVNTKLILTGVDTAYDFISRLEDSLVLEDYEAVTKDYLKDILCGIVLGLGSGGIPSILISISLPTYKF